MDQQQQMNDAIALMIGRLTIENQALRLQVAALQEQLAKQQEPKAGNAG